MKSKFLLLIIGLAGGLGLHFLLSTESTPLQSAREIPVAEAPEPVSVAPVQRPVARPASVAPAAVVQNSPPRNIPVISEVVEAKTLSLRIDEELLALIEQERDQLQDYAYAEHVQDGWKIKLLPGDRVFAKAGFKTGDVITVDSLRAQLSDEEQSPLAQRMMQILQTIER
jgi:hypothetical protein